MKVLMLTVTAGEGHNSVARAVATSLGTRCEVKVHDLFKGVHKIREKAVNDGYFWICANRLHFATNMYRKTIKRDPKKKPYSFAHIFANAALPRLLKVIKEYKPDVVFATHIFGAILMSDLRRKKGIHIPVAFMNTDFVPTTYSECATWIDYTITPDESFEAAYIKKGFKSEQILSMGMPVMPRFSSQIEPQFARRSLGLDENLFTVLVMNGGVGFGSSLEIIQNLSLSDKKFQVIVVNGKNQKMKQDISRYLREKGIKNVKNIGFTRNVDVLMSASDVLIGKMGALTLTEACNKGLPVLAVKRLPCQEYYNMRFFKRRGACEHIRNMDFIYKYIDRYIENPSILATLRENLAKLAKKNACNDIANLLIDMAEHKSGQKSNAEAVI